MRSVCGVLIGLLCLAGFAVTANAEVTLTIPKALKAPELDGVLSDGEWDDAAAVTGVINQFDGVAHPRQRMQYDGYVLHRIRFEPPREGEQVDRIRLVVPLRSSQGTYLHAAGGVNMRAAVSAIKLGEGDGKLWDSGQSRDRNYNARGLTVGNFKPFVWVGGARRGMAFMADSDKDWVPDETKKVSAIEVVRTEECVELVLNLVARPFSFHRPREVVFSLQATPVKKLPDDFRHVATRIHTGAAFPGRDPDGWSWDGQQLWMGEQTVVGGGGSNPYPLNWERNLKRRNGHMLSDMIFTPYQAMNAVLGPADVDDPRVVGLHGQNLAGYLFNEITTAWEWGDAVIGKADMEYRLWHYRRWIPEIGLTGMYFDNTYPSLDSNVEAGRGYVIDLPDRPDLHGKIQPGYAVTGAREFFKRLRTLFVQEGKTPHIWLHATDAFVISAFSFVDYLLDGENGPYITPEQPWMSEKPPILPEHMQAMNNPAKWGVAVNYLKMIQVMGTFHLERKCRLQFRNMTGYYMLHDAEPATYHYCNWDGIDLKRPAEFLPYWDPQVGAALQADKPDVVVSAWRQDGALRVLVFNLGKDDCDVAVRADLPALGLSAKDAERFEAIELEPEARWKDWKDGDKPADVLRERGGELRFGTEGHVMTVHLPILARNYRLFLLRIE
jgi:hypothetical protein